MKKILIATYWMVVIAISLWIMASFMDVNYCNIHFTDLAPWNFFEIIYQWGGV
jgi:hypothetical protein